MQVISFPASKDWSKDGAVTPVRDQGYCAVSWAFSATAYIEGMNYIKNNQLVQLSEQNLIDCTYGETWGNLGCQGGLAYYAFRYAQTNPLMEQQDYPYSGKDPNTGGTSCSYSRPSRSPFQIIGVNGNAMLLVDELKSLLAASPVVVAVQASNPIFYLYTGGIITDSVCGNEANHAVLAVGYG